MPNQNAPNRLSGQYSCIGQPIDFRNVVPNEYFLRVIYDSNGNKKYDSGNYLSKIQPERISHYTDVIEVRANWDPIIDFTLLD